MARAIRRTELNECRQCSTFCDRVIRPATCVAAACPALYQYDDPLTGRRYMGCLHKVFATEIDVALFEEAERTRAGYGAVKLAGAPLRRCAFQVEQAFDWRARDRRRARTAASSTGRTPRATRSAPSTCATGSRSERSSSWASAQAGSALKMQTPRATPTADAAA